MRSYPGPATLTFAGSISSSRFSSSFDGEFTRVDGTRSTARTTSRSEPRAHPRRAAGRRVAPEESAASTVAAFIRLAMIRICFGA